MKNQLILLLILLFCIVWAIPMEAQNVLKLSTRHSLKPNGIPSVGFQDVNESILKFHGVAMSYQKDRNTYKLYEFGAGFNMRNINGEENSTEIFIDANWKIFKDILDKEKLQSFFSLRPRAFYIYYEDLLGFTTRVDKAAIELPIVINIEYFINPKWRIYSSINGFNTAFGFDRQDVDNPNLTERQQVSAGFDLDVTIFSEMRIGVGYILNTRD